MDNSIQIVVNKENATFVSPDALNNDPRQVTHAEDPATVNTPSNKLEAGVGLVSSPVLNGTQMDTHADQTYELDTHADQTYELDTHAYPNLAESAARFKALIQLYFELRVLTD